MAGSKKKSKARRELMSKRKERRRERRAACLTALALTGDLPPHILERAKGMDSRQMANYLYSIYKLPVSVREIIDAFFPDKPAR